MVYLNILGLHSGSVADLPTSDVADNRDNEDSNDEWGAGNREGLPRHGTTVVLLLWMYMIYNALCIKEWQGSDT